jgi:hypothetical protein
MELTRNETGSEISPGPVSFEVSVALAVPLGGGSVVIGARSLFAYEITSYQTDLYDN